MLHVANILVPVDLGVPNPALSQALHWAHRLKAVVHAIEMRPMGGDALPTFVSARPSDAVQRMVDDHVRRLKLPPGVGVRSMRQNVPSLAQGAAWYAAEHGIDLIIASPFSHEFTDMVRRIPLPMHVVDSSVTPALPAFHRVLVPIDFSRHAQRALAHARALAALFDAPLNVLHVLERPPYVALNSTDMLALSDAKLPERRARRRAAMLLDNAPGPSVDAHCHVTHGDPVQEIVSFVDGQGHDVIVLSSHGSTSRAHHPLGTVADKLVRRLDTSIFLIKSFGASLVPHPLQSASFKYAC